MTIRNERGAPALMFSSFVVCYWTMSLNALEEVVNEMSDKDWSWWPFLWLRPAREAPLSLGRMVAIAVLYGLPCSAMLALALAFARPEARGSVPVVMVGFPLLFLFVGTVLVAPMWNRRAERLRARIK